VAVTSPTAQSRDAGRGPEGMTSVPGGTFRMGDESFYPEEGPVHAVSVDGFWIDEYPVTNAEFGRFVDATGHVTVAEIAPDPAEYPDADPALLVAGSAVFHKTAGRVDLRDFTNWWAWMPGASWRHPEGPTSHLAGREHHPVVHVATRASARRGEGLLRPTQPTCRRRQAEPGRRRTRCAHPPARYQGRVLSVRTQLLPALPACGTPERDHRDLNRTHRIPLRRATARYRLVRQPARASQKGDD
jgi:Sulfatase-modifying factor enzyme 1